MNSIERALIEKAGNDHGFEYILPSAEHAVHLASARHRAQVRIVSGDLVRHITNKVSEVPPVTLRRSATS